MSGLTEQFVVLLIFSCFFALCEGTLKVPVKPGDDTPLQCQSLRDAPITLIEWKRTDLRPDDFVFNFRDNRPYDQDQLPSFRGRVELRDPEMKDGDASVILKNVTVNDTGTYECFVRTGSSGEPEFRQSVTLKVTDPGTLRVPVKTGEDVTLQCEGPTDESITVIEWSRADLKSDGYVFNFRDSRPNEQNQLPSFRGRVELRDSKMKNGDASVILKNVNINDAGTYECFVRTRSSVGPELRKSVILKVLAPPHVFVLKAYKGDEFVQLPCESSNFDMDDPTVEWRRDDLRPSTVHQLQQKRDELKDQNQLYSGRTSMMTDALETGDLSLNLTKLRLSDSGTYTCIIRTSRWGQQRVSKVQLQVKDPPERFPTWLIVLLVLLGVLVLVLVVGGLWYLLRQYFMSDYRVEVDSGVESVQLPCKTFITIFHQPEDVSVVWTDRGDRKVHVYRNGSDQPEEQDRYYKGRTEMKRNLKTGDLSLTLKYPTNSEIYTCTVYSRDRKTRMDKQVELWVKVCQVEVKEGAESVQLPFKTTGDLPEDTRVEWKRFEPKHMMVHVYKNGSIRPEEQDKSYRDRTEMKDDLLRTGDLSLILKNPKHTETGEYRCDAYSENGSIVRCKTVKLKVKERTQIKDETVDIRNRSSSTDPTPLIADQSV